jgi:hypothetical protein
MKYFTRELLARLSSEDDAVVRAAEAEWEQANERYEARLREIEPALPQSIRELNDLLLHDALVWSIARRGQQLLLILRKDVPPQDLVVLTYTLADEPRLDPEALPPEQRLQVVDFQYDELDVEEKDGQKIYTQSILFGHGWEMALRFSDVEVTVAEPLYPAPGTTLVLAPTSVLPQSA